MLLIRKAILNDSEIISRYLFLAMDDLVYKFIGTKDENLGREFMLHFVKRESNQYSYQNCWVAEDDSHVAAAVNVYDGAFLSELREPVIEYVRARFNADFNPEDETGAGEYYIDTLGVDPTQQRKGIGTQLLRFVIDEYVNRQNQTLGLLVDDSNPNAKRLYLRLGFRSVGSKVLLGQNMEHLQVKGG
jgi:ribosomal protein S18 acetylase RimI-like enzyme